MAKPPTPDRKIGEAMKTLSGQRGHALWGLLEALELSLEKGRRSLLALDLEGIAMGTREQIPLIAKLGAMVDTQQTGAGDMQSAGETGSPALPSDSADKLRSGAHRVQCAARIQLALLARSQAKLRVLSNMLAGSSADYALRRGSESALAAAVSRTLRRESDPCRV